MRRWFQPAAALVTALSGAACLLDNPAFGDTSASGSGGASGAASSTGGAGTSGAGTGGTSSGGLTGGVSASASATDGVTGGVTGGLTSGGSTGGGTGALCGMADEPCVNGQCCGDCLVCKGDVCMADPAMCGVCEGCVAGACTKTPGASCELPEAMRCENFVYGALFDGCYAYAPTPGVCAADSTCTPACMQPADMPLVACDQACQDPFACAQGLPTKDLMGFCTYNAPTEQCKPTCIDSANASAMTFFGCNGFGSCTHVMPDIGCGFYVCNDTKTACLTKCDDQSDCVFSTSCKNSVCAPE